MNRSTSRSSAVTSGLAACGIALVAALSGCSAGQISQSSVQEPAINGANAIAGNPVSGIALRNLHVRAPQTVDYVQTGQSVELLFVAVNESGVDKDRLTQITSPYGTVTLTGTGEIPAGGTLLIGTPDQQPSPLDVTESANTGEAKVVLKQQITNGLTYPFTFTFERSGVVTVEVPISAGEAKRREVAPPVEAAGEPDTGGQH